MKKVILDCDPGHDDAFAMGLGLIAIAFAIPYGKFAALLAAPCIYYFGTSFFYSPIVDTATLTVSPEESGRVMGINDLVQAITGSVGVAVFGQMMSAGVMSGGSITGVCGKKVNWKEKAPLCSVTERNFSYKKAAGF